MRALCISYLAFFILVLSAASARAEGYVYIEVCSADCNGSNGLKGLTVSVGRENQTTDSDGVTCIALDNSRRLHDRVAVTVNGGRKHASETFSGIDVVAECRGEPLKIELEPTHAERSEVHQVPVDRPPVRAATPPHVAREPTNWAQASSREVVLTRGNSLMTWKVVAFTVGGIAVVPALVTLVLGENARSRFNDKTGCGTKLPDKGVVGCDELYREQRTYNYVAGGFAGAALVALAIGWFVPSHTGSLDVQSNVACAPYADAGLSCKLAL